MKDEVGFKGLEQPKLAPVLLDKIADTFTRRLGGSYTASDAAAWWNWVWPVFEGEWQQRRYKNLGRAILQWAGRTHMWEVEKARKAGDLNHNQHLVEEQRRLNAASQPGDEVVQIDYFAKLGGKRS